MRAATPLELAVGVMVLALYVPATVGMYYLGARARLTEFAWSRYPAWLDYYTLCAACSGVLYGLVAWAVLGAYLELPYLVLPGRFWVTPIAVAGSSMIWTPMLAARHLAALETTSPPPATEKDGDGKAE